MRDKGTTIQQVILGLALLAALCWNLAHANEINRLDIESDATSTRAELHLQSAPTFKTFSLSQPDRLVVDLSGVDPGKTLQLPAPNGLIKGVRTGRPAEATTRIVFDLAHPVAARKPRLETDAGGVRLVLEWPNAGQTSVARTGSVQTGSAQTGSALTTPAQTGPTGVAATGAGPTGAGVSTAQQADVPASGAATSAMTVKAPSPPQFGSASIAQDTGAQVAQPHTQNTLGQGAAAPTTAAPAAPDRANPFQVKPASSAATSPVAEPTTNAGKPVASVEAQAGAGAESVQTPPIASQPMPRNLTGRPLIVAIDPGHGGQDPGAVGPSGKREKDVTLAIARELARQVNATPGLKAVLTRDSDMFLPLTRRTQLARQAKADIFVSIHADAAENRAAKGSSVYVLSLRGASSQRARWLADKENAADLIGGHALPKADNTLTSVLLDLTQSGQMRASESAAAQVLDGLKDIGNNHKPNIERANFAVLRTSDMPAMLVETAFISNPDEERRLSDPAFQRNLARAVLAGVDRYFQRQPPPGTLYAARAKANEAQKNLAQAPAMGAKPTSKSAVVAKTPPATAGGSPK
jgi:N-acetylmuramoyl-L-alanine amidase